MELILCKRCRDYMLDTGHCVIRKDDYYDSPLLLIRGICDNCNEARGFEYILKPATPEDYD